MGRSFWASWSTSSGTSREWCAVHKLSQPRIINISMVAGDGIGVKIIHVNQSMSRTRAADFCSLCRSRGILCFCP